MLSMYKKILALLLSISIFTACSTEPPKKQLTISEQIEVDTKNAQGLSTEFKQQVHFIALPKAERFLKNMAEKILKQKEGFDHEKVEIKIHDDSQAKLERFFSFPGVTLSIPMSFLKKVEFENELAAALAYEIANVMDRFLAQKVEAKLSSGELELFGKDSVFGLNDQNRSTSIKLATSLLYGAGFDTRGIASIFKRYPIYYMQESASDLFQKEVDFNIREAQRAKSEFMPQMKPIVRSGEFIQFKKELLKATREGSAHAHKR